MAKRPTQRSVRSKQNAVLRYVVSTDVKRTSQDLGVSEDSLRRFLSAKPETVRNNPSKYGKILGVEPRETARNSDVKLVQRLSGKRLSKAYNRYGEDERLTRAIRLAQATRQRRKIVDDGKVRYVPLKSTEKGSIARKQILNNMSGQTSKSIIDQYQSGTLNEEEARSMLSQLWKNSGAKDSDQYFVEHT